MPFVFDPSSRGDADILARSRALRMEREYFAATVRRRSAGEAATAVAESMVATGVREYPDVFGNRDVGPLVALIRNWLLQGGA